MNNFKRKTYDVIFSLGEACFVATILKNCGLRKFSSPFDWMFGATFAERFRIFLDDFAHFTDKEDFQAAGQRTDPHPQDIYYNKRTGITFNHDFPMNGSLDNDYPAVAEKYARRINRLIKEIKQARKVLIVYMDIPETQRGAKDNAEIAEMVELAGKKYPDTRIDILYIRHNENMKDKEFSISQYNDNIILAECFNREKESDVNWTDNFANVSEIMRHIQVTKTFKERLAEFKHNNIAIEQGENKTHLKLLWMHLTVPPFILDMLIKSGALGKNIRLENNNRKEDFV